MQANIGECPSFEGCEAPLCPLDEGLSDAAWYPDEDICVSRKFPSLHWLKRQKRLRKYKAPASNGYFTKEMLENMRRCSSGTKGINPDGRKAVEMAGVVS